MEPKRPKQVTPGTPYPYNNPSWYPHYKADIRPQKISNMDP